MSGTGIPEVGKVGYEFCRELLVSRFSGIGYEILGVGNFSSISGKSTLELSAQHFRKSRYYTHFQITSKYNVRYLPKNYEC